MPLTADNTVQESSGTGHTTGTTLTATLPSGTTAGNTVLIFVGVTSAASASGFTADKVITQLLTVLRKPDVSAGETSWTVTFANAGAVDVGYSWYVVEESGLDLVDPLDVSVSNGPVGVADGGTLSTGTAPQNAGLDTVAYAVYGVSHLTGTTGSWSGYTSGFDEVVDVAAPATPGGCSLAVARRFPGSTGTFECTGTLATTGSSPNAGALLVAYRSADSPVVAPLAMIAGFDWLTHGGLTSHSGVTNMLGTSLALAGGTWGTNFSIGPSFARNSAGGLEIACAASVAYVRVGNLSAKVGTYGFNVRVVSSTGTVVVAEVLDSGGATRAQLVYDTATTKFGVRAGTTGTISYESGTTAANVWRWVDLRVNTAGTTHTVDWRIETAADTYADQVQASLAGQTAGTVQLMLAPGRQTTAQTMRCHFDDVCLSAYYSAFPLSPHEVRLLTVDPAGTPSVSGTASNFSVFTGNGTLGAWNAANARDAVDDVPPTVSASADGVVQTAVAAGDYVEFPMASYAAGPDETIVGVRMLCPEWGGTGTGTGTIGYRGWDGTTETTLIAAGTSYDPDSLTALSATYPRWACAMWQSVNGWTQAELDAAAVRVGYSTDATPDMGVHAVYLEVAIGRARTQQLFGDLASAAVDPNRGGTVAVTVAPPAGYDTTLHYEESGSPTDVPVTGGTTVTEQINATFEPDVNYVAAYPAAEPVPVD